MTDLETLIKKRIWRLAELRKEAYKMWELEMDEDLAEDLWLEFQEHSFKIEALEGILEEYRSQ